MINNNIIEIINRKNNKPRINLEKRRKITSINEVFDGKKLVISDFSNLDLSNLDLSVIPPDLWQNCIFYNTNFANTGIKFIPNKLKCTNFNSYVPISINYCDFSGNDLSYLTKEDFKFNRREIETVGCNFRNTSLKHDTLMYLYDVVLDESFGDYPFEYWGDFDGINADFDIFTVFNNPFLNLSSSRLVRIFEHFTIRSQALLEYKYVPKISNWKWTVDPEKMQEVVNICEYGLQFDKQGYFRKFYEEISKHFTLENKYWFFRIEIKDALIKDVNIQNIPIQVLIHYYFNGGNIFENASIDNSIADLTSFHSEQFYDGGNRNKFNSLYLPGITYGSWKEKPAEKRRISSSAITFFTKVYLELSRVCNARCKFCRNESFEKSSYNLEQILETLQSIKEYLNAVVIGGGEPTLRLEDAIFLKEQCIANNIDWHIFTNGTNPNIIEDTRITRGFKINLSRHAIKDSDNAAIFGVNPSKIMTTQDIRNLNDRAEVTLNATCFKGGLDTPAKILDYIDFAREIGCSKVLIQNLQRDSSLGLLGGSNRHLHIDNNALNEVIDFLKNECFALQQKKYPIYASGGYVSYIFKDPTDGFSISIQKYITKEELSQNWPKAVKRAFDLSIDPTGKLYENWHQNNGEVDLQSLQK